MQTSIPYDFMPPEQHFSSPADLLSSIESYQQTRAFASGDTRFNPPEGKFELLSDEEGGFVLMPAAKDYGADGELGIGPGRLLWGAVPGWVASA